MAGLCDAADTLGVHVDVLKSVFETSALADPRLAPTFARLTYLDISFGHLSNLSMLAAFPNLDTIIADQNEITSLTHFPYMARLTTLSLNKNGVHDLVNFLHDAQTKLPSLVFLSLLGNPCCPSGLGRPSGPHDSHYTVYCNVVAEYLPTLRFLDSHAISADAVYRAVNDAQLKKAKKDELHLSDLSSNDSGAGSDNERWSPRHYMYIYYVCSYS